MIDEIVARLQACPTLVQVMRADEVGCQSVDTAELLVSLLSPIFGDDVYPLLQDEGAAYPSVVYQLVGSARVGPEGLQVLRTDTYVLQIRSQSFPQLLSLVKSLRESLLGYSQQGDAGSVSIQDMLVDPEHDQGVVRCSLEIDVTHIAAASQGVPVVFVFPLRSKAEPSSYDNLVRQVVTDEFGVLLLAKSPNVRSVCDSVDEYLLGYQEPGWFSSVQYVEGGRELVLSGLTLWRQVYQVKRLISQ